MATRGDGDVEHDVGDDAREHTPGSQCESHEREVGHDLVERRQQRFFLEAPPRPQEITRYREQSVGHDDDGSELETALEAAVEEVRTQPLGAGEHQQGAD